jgi:hypothetical protein
MYVGLLSFGFCADSSKNYEIRVDCLCGKYVFVISMTIIQRSVEVNCWPGMGIEWVAWRGLSPTRVLWVCCAVAGDRVFAGQDWRRFLWNFW